MISRSLMTWVIDFLKEGILLLLLSRAEKKQRAADRVRSREGL